MTKIYFSNNVFLYNMPEYWMFCVLSFLPFWSREQEVNMYFTQETCLPCTIIFVRHNIRQIKSVVDSLWAIALVHGRMIKHMYFHVGKAYLKHVMYCRIYPVNININTRTKYLYPLQAMIQQFSVFSTADGRRPMIHRSFEYGRKILHWQ
jgi:hypothetical protein